MTGFHGAKGVRVHSSIVRSETEMICKRDEESLLPAARLKFEAFHVAGPGHGAPGSTEIRDLETRGLGFVVSDV
jgi:hypothetical protein